MIRKLMASSALLALLSAGAITVAQAQTDTGTQPPAATQEPAAGTDATAPAAGADAAAPAAEEQPVQTEIAKDAPTLTPDEPTIATAFIGRSVYSSEDPQSDNIGEVNDLIIGSDGMITHAVVGVGGFLGIGQKDVAVPFDQLRVVQDENADVRLIFAATREELEAAEAFDRSAFDPEERAQEQQEQADEAAGGATTGDAATGAATTGAATTGGTTTGDAATEPAADANQTGEAQTQQQQPAAVITDAAPAETEQQTAATPPATPPPAEEQATTETAAPAVAGAGGFVSFSADQMRASRLMGQEIYGNEGESIGEVSDLVLQEDGSTRAAIIDVGGFLGIGEKRVAIPFNDIQVTAPAEMQATAGQEGGAATTDPATGGAATTAPAAGDPAVGGNQAGTVDPAAGGAAGTAGTAGTAAATDEPRLTINMTREQLEQLPEWQDPAQLAAEQNAADQAATGAGGTATTADQTAAGTTPGQTGAATDPNAAPGAGGAATGNQYQAVTQELTADNLMGAPVFGSNEENLGEVGDVVFDMNGQIQAVVVDVGGFLGIGEKPVALQFEALQVQRGETGDFRLMANATQEQLEGAPSYDEETADAGAGGNTAATGGTATGGTDAGGTTTTITPAPAPAQ